MIISKSILKNFMFKNKSKFQNINLNIKYCLIFNIHCQLIKNKMI